MLFVKKSWKNCINGTLSWTLGIRIHQIVVSIDVCLVQVGVTMRGDPGYHFQASWRNSWSVQLFSDSSPNLFQEASMLAQWPSISWHPPKIQPSFLANSRTPSIIEIYLGSVVLKSSKKTLEIHEQQNMFHTWIFIFFSAPWIHEITILPFSVSYPIPHFF